MNNEIYREVYVTRETFIGPISYMQSTNAIPILFKFCDYDIPQGATARIIVEKPSGKIMQDTALISENTIKVNVKTQMFSEVGTSYMQVQVEKQSQILVTFDQKVYVSKNRTEPNAPQSENESSFFQELQNAADAANQAAQAANDAADNLTPEAIQNAVNNYLEENPVSGMTEEQEQQLQTNTENIKKIEGILNTKAPAIHQTAAGNPITLTDAGEGTPVVDFAMDGKTEQVQTTGAQLFDFPDKEKGVVILNGITYTFNLDGSIAIKGTATARSYIKLASYSQKIKLPQGNYTIGIGVKCPSGSSVLIGDYNEEGGYKGTLARFGAEIMSKTFAVSEESGSIDAFFDISSGNTIDLIIYPMLNAGSEALPYEPYTGNQPSPSPDYPQEIINAGKCNEESQKWEYEVTVQGKNLFNPTKFVVDEPKVIAGRTYILRSDGGIEVTTQDSSSSTTSVFFTTDPIYLPEGTTITLSGNPTGYNVSLQIVDEDGNDIVVFSVNKKSESSSYTLKKGEHIKQIWLYGSAGISDNGIMYIQLEIGDTATEYEMPKLPQTVLLQSDRPLTKWDRLEKRDGQWGWVFKSGMHVFDGAERLDYTINIYPRLSWTNFYNDNLGAINAEMYMENLRYAGNNVIKENTLLGSAGFARCFMYFDSTVDSKEAAVAKIMGRQIIYESAEETFVPLTESEQSALEALTTYFPTTIISNDADCEMEIEYVADTKTYIDNKFAELAQNLAATQNTLLEV